MINKILVESFPAVINEEFTARVENELDQVEEDKLVWNNIISDFYGPFKQTVDNVMEHQESIKGFLDRYQHQCPCGSRNRPGSWHHRHKRHCLCRLRSCPGPAYRSLPLRPCPEWQSADP